MINIKIIKITTKTIKTKKMLVTICLLKKPRRIKSIQRLRAMTMPRMKSNNNLQVESVKFMNMSQRTIQMINLAKSLRRKKNTLLMLKKQRR